MSNAYSTFVFVFFESNHQELKIGLRTYAFNFAQNKNAFVLFVSSSIFMQRHSRCVPLRWLRATRPDSTRPIYNRRIFCALSLNFLNVKLQIFIKINPKIVLHGPSF